MIAVHNKKTWSTSTTAEKLLSRWVTKTMTFSCVPSFFVTPTSHKSRMQCVHTSHTPHMKRKLLLLFIRPGIPGPLVHTWTLSDIMFCHFCAHAFCRQRASASFRWQLAFAANTKVIPIHLGPHSLQIPFFNNIRRRSWCWLYHTRRRSRCWLYHTGAVLSQVLQ